MAAAAVGPLPGERAPSPLDPSPGQFSSPLHPGAASRAHLYLSVHSATEVMFSTENLLFLGIIPHMAQEPDFPVCSLTRTGQCWSLRAQALPASVRLGAS